MEERKRRVPPPCVGGKIRGAVPARPPLYAIDGAGAIGAAANVGTVYLVGAGPGNPELLTIRAANVIDQGDVIVYDRLVGREIVALGRPGVQRIYVGKARSNHTLP